MKTDRYSFVHKAHRVRLFNLSTEIGRADFADPTDVHKIRGLLAKELVHLRDHARIEEHYIHPLFRKIPDASVAIGFDHDHQALEKEIEALEVLAKEARWNELHRVYNGFVGRYLVHLQEEEQAQEDILWKHLPDEDMAEVFAFAQQLAEQMTPPDIWTKVKSAIA